MESDRDKLTEIIRHCLVSECSTSHHYEAIKDYLEEDIKEIVDSVIDFIID